MQIILKNALSLFDSTPGNNQQEKSDKISKNAYLKYIHNYDLTVGFFHIILCYDKMKKSDKISESA